MEIFRSLLEQFMASIFERFHQALKQKSAAALALLCAAFRFLPLELYGSHFQAALEACLSLLKSGKQGELEKDEPFQKRQ